MDDKVPDGTVLVSIHAPAKEATGHPFNSDRGLFSFNPRPREGGDDIPDWGVYYFNCVSIHAPAKEAT